MFLFCFYLHINTASIRILKFSTNFSVLSCSNSQFFFIFQPELGIGLIHSYFTVFSFLRKHFQVWFHQRPRPKANFMFETGKIQIVCWIQVELWNFLPIYCFVLTGPYLQMSSLTVTEVVYRCEKTYDYVRRSCYCFHFSGGGGAAPYGVTTGCILSIGNNVLLHWIQTSLSYKPEIFFSQSKRVIWAYSFAKKK